MLHNLWHSIFSSLMYYIIQNNNVKPGSDSMLHNMQCISLAAIYLQPANAKKLNFSRKYTWLLYVIILYYINYIIHERTEYSVGFSSNNFEFPIKGICLLSNMLSSMNLLFYNPSNN